MNSPKSLSYRAFWFLILAMVMITSEFWFRITAMKKHPLFAAIEGGGTKFLVGLFDQQAQLLAKKRIQTRAPEETLAHCVEFIQENSPRFGTLAGLGIAHFGPLDVLPESPQYGRLKETPKPGWCGFDVLGFFRQAFDPALDLAIDTDVNGAVLAEARWGAGKGFQNLLYLTIGTGIGGGALVHGKLLHGYAHTEMGHISLARVPGDNFKGICPSHGDCFEGLCTGPAIAARWGNPAIQLPDDHPAWTLEAAYIAQALRSYAYILAPERIILGGGVMDRRFLFPLVRAAFEKEMAGYGTPATSLEDYIVPSGFKGDAGLYGALGLILDKNRI